MFFEGIINFYDSLIAIAIIQKVANNSKEVQERIIKIHTKNTDKIWQKSIILNCINNMLQLIYLDMRLDKQDVDGELKNKLQQKKDKKFVGL